MLSEDEAKGVAKGVGFELADDARGEIYHKEDLAGKTQMIANRQAYNSMFHMSGRIQLGWVSGNLTNNQKHNIALVYLEEWLHGLQELRAKNNPDNSNISNRGQREGTIDHEADVALFMSEQGIPLADVFVSRYGRSAYVSAAAKQNGTSRIIGRGDETDFRLPSVLPKVSRQHARIYYQNGAWYIEDLKSTNGTFVNGKKISGSQKIINGDTVSLADVVFTVKVSNDTVTLTDQTGVLGSLSISDTGAITSTIEERKMHDFSTVGSTKNYNPASPVNQRIALGRQPQGSNDALFTDSSVSRRHAELYVANGKWAVLDTGSGNGTFVNGGRIGEGYEVVARMLNNGDTIRLGQEVFLKIAIGKNNILTLTRVVAPAARPELLPSGQALMKLMEFDGDPDILTAQVGGLLAQEIAPYVQQLKPGTSIAKQQEIFTKIEAVLRTYDAQAKKDSGRVRSDLERSIALVRDILADAGFIDPATGKKAISKAGLIDLLIPSFKGNVPDWVRDTIDVFIDAHPGLALANRLYQAPENIDELKNTLKEFLQEVNKALTPYSKLPKVFNGIVSSAQFVIQTFPRSPTVWSPSFASIQAAKTHLTEAQQAISGKELDKARILLSKADKEIPPDSPLRPAIGDEYKAAQQALQRASAPEKPPEAPAEEARTIFELVNARTTDFTITISPDQVPAQLKLLIQQFAPIMKLVPSDIQVSATFDPSTQTWNVIGNISSREQTIELSLIPDEKNGFAFLKKELTGFGGLTFIIKVALTPKRALDLLNKKDPDVQKLDAYHKITRLALDASGNIILSGTTQTAPRTLEAPGLLTQLDEVAETAVVAVTKLAPETKASVVANLRILAKDIRAFETQGRTRDEALGEVLKKFHSDPFFQNYGLVKGYFFLHLSDPESYPLNIVGRGLSRTSTDKIRAWMVDQSEKKRELGLVQMEWLRELLDRFGIQLSLNELSLDHYPLIVGDNATFDQYGFGNDVVAFYDERLGLYVLRDRVTLSQAQRDKLDAIIFRILSHEVSHDMLRAYGPWMNDTGSEGLATGLMVMLEVFANNTSWEAAEQIIRGTVSSGYWSKYLFLRSQGSSPLGDLITRALSQGDDQRVAEGLLRFWQTTKDVKPVEGRIGRHGVAVVLGRHMIEAFGEMLNLTPEQTAGQRNLLTAFFEESLLNETPDQPFVRAVNVSASFSPEEMAQAQQALIEKVATLTVDDYAPDSPWAGWQDFVTALQHGSPIENALRQDVLNALVPIEGIFARARITERQGLPVDNTQADVEALFTKLLDRYAHVPFDRAVMSDLGGGTVFINQIIVTRGSTDIKTAWTEYVAKHGIDINASPSYLHPIRVPREGEVVDESKLEPVTSIHPDVFKWYTNALFVILKQPNPLNRNEETGEFVETEIARLFGTEDFGGPAFYGVVKRIDGSEAYAIEFLPDVITVKMSGGKLALEPPIDNPGMSDGEMRRRITPQVASQMWARFKQVLLAGYYPDDFQVLVDGAGRVYLFDPGEYKLLSQFFPNIALTEEGVEDFYRNFLSKTVFGSSFAELNKLAERNEEQYSLTVPVQSGGLALAAIPIATKVVRGGVVLVDSALNHPSWWQGMVAAARNVDDFVWSPVNRLVRQIYVDLRERFPESTALSRLAGVIPQAPSIVWFPGGANVSDIQPEDEAPETISDPLAQKRADERRLFEEGLRSLTESWQSLTNALTSGKTIGEFSISRALSQKLINDITLLEGRIQLSNKLKTSGQGTLTEADIRRYLEVMQRAYQGLTVDNVFKDAQARNSPLTREMIAQYEVDIEEFRTHFDDFLSSHLRMRELTNVQQLETEDGTVSIRDIWERMLREAGKTTQSTVPADYYERSKPEVLTFTTDGQERDVMLPVVAHSELRRTSDPKRVRARVIPVVHEMQFNDNNEPMYPFIVNELFFEDTSQTYQPVARHFDEITDITDALGLGYADFEFFGIGPFGEEVWGIILEEQTSAGWDRLESPPGPGTGGGEQPEETGYQRLERLIEDQRKDFQHYRTSKSDNRSTRLGEDIANTITAFDIEIYRKETSGDITQEQKKELIRKFLQMVRSKYSTWLREYDRELFDAVVTEQNAPDQNPTPLDDFIGKKMPPNLLPTWKDMLQEGTGTGGEGQTRVEELQAMIGRQERNFSNLDATLGLEIAKKEKASVILDQDLGYTLLVLHRAILNAQKAGEITQEQKQELVMEVLRMVRRKYNMWLRGSYEDIFKAVIAEQNAVVEDPMPLDDYIGAYIEKSDALKDTFGSAWPKVRQEELGRGGGGEVEDGDQQINPIQSVITSAQEVSLSQESPRTFVSRLVAWMRGRFSTDRTFSNREKLASLQAKRITTFPPFPTLYTVTLSDNTRNVFKVFEKQPLNDPRELFGNSLQAWGFVGAHREELASEMADILNLSDIFGYNPVPTAVRRTEVINAKEWAGVLTPFINKASEADFSFGTSIDSRQKQAIMWFDFLLGNTDRDWRNILLVPNPNDRKRPQVYLIDHAAAFAPGIDGYDSSNVLRLSPSEEINSEIFDHFKTILSDKEKIQEIAGRFDRAIVQATDPVTRALLQEAKDGFMRRVEILLKTTNAFPQPVETSWKDANIGVVNAFTELFYPEFARQSPDEQQKQYDLRTVLVREAGIRLGEGDDKRSVDEIVSEINSKLRYGLVVTEAQKTDLNRSKSSYINLLLEVQKEELGTGGGGGTVFGAGLGGFGQLFGVVLDVGSDVTGFFAELIGPETAVGRRLESLSRSLFRQSVAMNPPFVGLSADKTSTVEPPAWYLEVLPSDQKQSTEADMPEIDGSRFGDRKEDVESSARVLRSFLAAPLIQDYFERDGSKTERGTRLYWLEQMYQKLKRDRGEAAAEGFYQWYRSNRFNRETLDPVLPAVLKLEGVLSIELIERSKELAARLGEYDELPISDRFRVVFDTTKLVRDALRYLATGQFPPAKPGDVTLVREQFYKELQQKVVQAFVTRPVQHSNPLFGQTDEQMRQSQKIADEYIGLPDNAVIHISGTTGPGEVFIDDSHDYPTLLRMALLVVEYPERFIEDVIQKTLEHEFYHAVPGLGQEGVKIRYGIEFSKDPDTGATLITPMVKPVGDISVGLYKDMISAPKVLSFSDRAGLGLPFGPQEPTKPEVVVREPIEPPAESTQPSLEESGDTGGGGEVEDVDQPSQFFFIDSLITALNGIDLPDAANGVSRLEQLQTRTHPFKGNPLRGNRELGLTDETIAAKENRSTIVEAMTTWKHTGLHCELFNRFLPITMNR